LTIGLALDAGVWLLTDYRCLGHDTHANETASMASQIQTWERGEGTTGNAFLYLSSYTTATATRSHPHPSFTPTLDVTTTPPVCTLFARFFGLLISALLLEAYSLDQ
jgi:hypothetical protein